MTQTTSSIILRYKQVYHDAVPHLYQWTGRDKSGQKITKSEITVHICDLGEEDANWHFLYRQEADRKRVFFSQSHPADRFDLFKAGLADTCQQEPIFCDSDGY